MKKTIIFKFKHIYTFYSNGIYEINQLKKNYKIILIVEKSFLKNKKFKTFLKANKDIKVFYLEPIKRFSFISHRYYKKRIIKIFNEVSPDILIQNDYIELENMYLFDAADLHNKNILKIVLALSNSSNESTFSLIDQLREAKIKRYLRLNSISKLVLFVFYRYKMISSFISNYFIPILVGIKRPYLGLSAYNNIDYVPRYIPFTFYFSYQDFDNKYIKKIFLRKFDQVSLDGIFFRINSPPLDLFFNNIKKIDNSIIYFPSLLGIKPIDVAEEKKIKKCLDIIMGIYIKEGLQTIGVKFHPNIMNIGNNLEIFKRIIKEYFPKAIIYDFYENSTELTAAYSYIVGDVSSVLVQAGNFNNKIVISIDSEDFPVSDIMKKYPHINYIKSIDKKSIIKKVFKKSTLPSNFLYLEGKIKNSC